MNRPGLLVRLALFAAFAAATVAMCVGHGVRTRPILADDQLYFYMSERAASGVPPHIAQMEVKTQLPTMLSGAAIAMGRRLGVDDVMAGRAATMAAATAAVCLAWLLSLELTGSALASMVGAGATLAIYGLFVEATTGFQPKVFLVAFLLLTHLALARERFFLAGLAGMAAFLCWQPGGLVLASCALAVLLQRERAWRRAFSMGFGALVLFGAYEAYFAWQGVLAQQLHQEWALAAESTRAPFDALESAWFLLTESMTYQDRPHVLPTAFALVVATLWAWLLRRPRAALDALRSSPGIPAFWIAAHTTMAFTLYDHQAHPDLLLVQPYFAVASALAFGWIERAVAERKAWPSATRPVLASLVLAVAGQQAVANVRHTGRIVHDLDTQREMARVLDAMRDHRGSVWVVGSVHLLGLAHADNWIPIGNVGRETADFDLKTFRPVRHGRMPELLVYGRGFRPGSADWLSREYNDITPALFAEDRIRVYSRIQPPGTGFDRRTAPRGQPGPESRARPAAAKPATPLAASPADRGSRAAEAPKRAAGKAGTPASPPRTVGPKGAALKPAPAGAARMPAVAPAAPKPGPAGAAKKPVVAPAAPKPGTAPTPGGR